MGRVGTGKTTVAKRLASELDWPIFSSDKIRKTLAGAALAERTAPELREEIYSDEMTEQTYGELLSKALPHLKTGMVLSSTLPFPAARAANSCARNARKPKCICR